MAFDFNAILSQQTTTAGATSRKPIPVGEYKNGYISDLNLRTFTFKKGDKMGQEGAILVVLVDIQDDKLREEMGRSKVICAKDFFLDLKEDENGNPMLSWDGDDNYELGRLREALGQNKEGRAWAIELLTGGGPLVVRVDHETPNDDDPNDIRAKIKSFARQVD